MPWLKYGVLSELPGQREIAANRLADVLAEQPIDDRIADVVSNGAVVFVAGVDWIHEIVTFQPPDDYPFTFKHIGNIFVLDKAKDGRVTLAELLEFALYC